MAINIVAPRIGPTKTFTNKLKRDRMVDVAKRRDSGLGEEEAVRSSNSVKVEVNNFEKQDKNKKFAVYKVTINVDGRSIVVSHRYSEFLTLCSKMKKRHPEKQLKLPNKKLFATVDAEMVETRRVAIKEFVEKLASDKSIINCPDVQAFLAVSPSRCNSYETDDEAYYSMNASVQSSRRNSFVEDSLKEKSNRMKPSDFEFLRVVGNGSFGKVFLAKHRTDGKAYAVKVLNKHHVLLKNEARHVLCERQVLVKNSCHPFLVGLHFSFQTTDKLYLVMDYINGGEIEKRFSESRVRFYGAEIASALGFLHSHNIIYRDLKPENILLDAEGHIALTDFGLCKEGNQMASTFCGTPEYLAPEVLKQQPYDKMVDWWCLGAVLYELLLGLPPFYSRNREEMFEMTMNKPLEFRLDIISDNARDLLSKMLAKDKSERLGYNNDLKEIKQHPFFKSIDWNLLDQRKIAPPFIPKLDDGILDISNFDQQFTKLPVTESVTRTSNNKVQVRNCGQQAAKMFENFSYRRASPSESDEEMFCF